MGRMLKVQKLYDACKAAFSSGGPVPSQQALERVQAILESMGASDVGLDDANYNRHVTPHPHRPDAPSHPHSHPAWRSLPSDSVALRGDRAEDANGNVEIAELRGDAHGGADGDLRDGEALTTEGVAGRREEGLREGVYVQAQGVARHSPHVSPAITYLHVYECNDFSIGIFCIPASSSIPLHNHPGMTVLSKLLFGAMHVRAFDWARPDEHMPQDHFQPRLAELVEDRLVASPCPADVLFPTSGGNIHAFTALTPCAVLDVLAPPYNAEAGRQCTYFRELPPPSFPRLSSPAGLPEGREYGWLEEFQPPSSFVVQRGCYRGAKIIERKSGQQVLQQQQQQSRQHQQPQSGQQSSSMKRCVAQQVAAGSEHAGGMDCHPRQRAASTASSSP